jgi:hypothetical protein
MPTRIAVVRADTISSVEWPANEEAQRAARYLIPLMRDGPTAYVDNADVQVMALVVDSQVLPLVVSEEKPGNADVCSPYSHYVSYTLEEMAKRQSRAVYRLYRPVVLSAARGLRASHLDKVVYVNNWLFATNPTPALSAGRIAEVTDYLRHRYPDHSIVFRSVNAVTHPGFADALRECNYRMVASRTVYLLDPTGKDHLSHENAKRDARLLSHSGYDAVGPNELTDSDIARLTTLYRSLYLKKHSRLNPQFNERFFSLTVKANILSFIALKKNGRVDSFVAYHSQGGILTGAVLGYDLELPIKLGLYRLAFATFITEARRRGQLLNMSAGAGSFKVFRGASPCVEFDAVNDRHLPYNRRLAWSCLAAGGILHNPAVVRWLRW